MIQTVIFDLDGVIIDSEPVHLRIERQMFDELKIEMSFEEHCTYTGTSPQNMWEKIVDKYEIMSSNSADLVEKQHAIYMDYLLTEKDLHPIPGVVRLIRELKANRFQLIIASSATMKVIDVVLARFELSEYFMAKVSGSELIHSKPHPEIFLIAARLGNSPPTDCLVIEDSKNGITSAKAAGMKCIGFSNPNSGNQDLSAADVVIKSFDEVTTNFIRNLDN
jgi:HAD superfamily hydrolase (TIGR01509 family)